MCLVHPNALIEFANHLFHVFETGSVRSQQQLLNGLLNVHFLDIVIYVRRWEKNTLDYLAKKV